MIGALGAGRPIAKGAAPTLTAGVLTVSATGGNAIINQSTSPGGGTGAISVAVYRSLVNGFTPPSGTLVGTAFAISETGLTVGQTYYYRAIYTDSLGISVLSAQVAVTPAAFNEPAGYTLITERGFAASVEDSWIVDSGSVTIGSDASAPESPPSYARFSYTDGWNDGTSPADLQRATSGSPIRLYIRMQVRVSANWMGHESDVNKMGFAWANGSPICIINLSGTNSNPLKPDIRMQNTAEVFPESPTNDGARALTQNLATVAITRGQWFTVEAVLVSNTAGNADGEAHLWVNGTKVCEYTNCKWSGAGGTKTWAILDVDPIWGGDGGSQSSPAMTFDIDHYYASGKAT